MFTLVYDRRESPDVADYSLIEVPKEYLGYYDSAGQRWIVWSIQLPDSGLIGYLHECRTRAKARCYLRSTPFPVVP